MLPHTQPLLALTRSALEATAVLSPAARHASTSSRAPLCSMPQPEAAKSAGAPDEQPGGGMGTRTLLRTRSWPAMPCTTNHRAAHAPTTAPSSGAAPMPAAHTAPGTGKQKSTKCTWNAVLGQVNLEEALFARLHLKGGAVLAGQPAQKVGLARALRVGRGLGWVDNRQRTGGQLLQLCLGSWHRRVSASSVHRQCILCDG